MKPDLFHYEEKGDEARLYMSELSTCEALGIFAPTDRIAISKYGALHLRTKPQTWSWLNDLPVLTTAGDVISFLNQQNEREHLIDFAASIGEAKLSTHDDGEAHFRFSDQAQAVKVLRAFIAKDAPSDSVESIIKNPGKYVLLGKDEMSIFPTFEAYRSSLRSKKSSKY